MVPSDEADALRMSVTKGEWGNIKFVEEAAGGVANA